MRQSKPKHKTKTHKECGRCGREFPAHDLNPDTGRCEGCDFEMADVERVRVMYGEFPFV